MIARASVNRLFDLSDETERFVEIFSMFHQIAGEADKVRLQGVDLPNDFGGVAMVALKVKVTEVDETEVAVWIGVPGAHSKARRLNEVRLCGEGGGNRQRSKLQEATSGHDGHGH